jgi:cytochrome c oxidase subunit 3
MSNNISDIKSPNLQEHYSDMSQQKDASKLGMWIFLLTEILTFGGLFVIYAVFRSWNPEMFYNAHSALDIKAGASNTVVLITSSLTMALAVYSMQHDRKKQTIRFLGLTLLLACIFLVIKYFEYSHKIHLGQLPGKYYTYSGIEGTNPHIFFTIYFLMTGLHGLHVIIGMGLIGRLIYRTSRNDFSSNYNVPIELVGLFWHLVDIIWIYLFPLFYLIG